MTLSAILAVDQNGIIGREGRLPWHLPLDLKRFKTLTMGHALIMGRRTFESIGRALPGRRSLVLSRRTDASFPGAVTVTSLDAALEACRDETEVFVIGGARVFAEALPRCRRLYLTRVEAEVEGDVRIDLPDLEGWNLLRRETHPADDRHAHPFTFLDYERG